MPVSGATGIPPAASYLPESKVGSPNRPLPSASHFEAFQFLLDVFFPPTLNNTIPTCRQLLGPSSISALQHVAGVKLGYGKKEMGGTDRTWGGRGGVSGEGPRGHQQKALNPQGGGT